MVGKGAQAVMPHQVTSDAASLTFQYRTNLDLGGKAWTNHRVELWDGPVEIGHITMAYVDREFFDREFPTLELFCAKRMRKEPIPDWYRPEALRRYRRFEEFHVETAHVAFVTVRDELQCQGIGTRLYQEGGRWIGQHYGLMLAASDIQRPEAVRIWQKLREDPTAPTVQLRDGRWALDGRRSE